MLGTEYSWLLNPTDSTEASPGVRLASTGLPTLAVGVFCLFCIFALASAATRTAIPPSTGAVPPIAVAQPAP